MRIVLFLFTNIAVMLLFGTILNLVRIPFYHIFELIILAGLIGCGGSLISLLMSKSIVLRLINGKIIKNPCDNTEKWILHTIHNQSVKAGISTPQVAIYQASDINALATGSKKK